MASVEDAATLRWAAATGLIISSVFAVAGTSLARRPYAPAARRAGAMFAMWWYGIAATGIASALMAVIAIRGGSPRVIDAIDQAGLAAYALALAGFVSYLAFIFLGTYAADRVIFPIYAALALWSIVASTLQPATGYHVDAWRPIIERASPSWGPSPALMAGLLLVPVVVGIAAYANLRTRAEDAAARQRASLITAALFAWLTGVSVVSVPAFADSDAAQLVGRILVFGAALLLVIASRPAGAASEASAQDDLDARLRALI